MSDWDASEDEAAAPPATTAAAPKKSSKWADEDAEEEVADDWELSSSDEAAGAKERAEAAGPKGPVRNKGVTKQKIAEREAQELQERLAAEAREAEEADPQARKVREQKRTLDADMENARGLFGDANISSDAAKDSPWEMNPRTKEQFDEMAVALSEHILKRQGSKPLYPTFLESFVKHLASPLNDVQTRKLASTMTAAANEKQKQAKDAAKKGGAKAKAKPGLGGLGGSASVAAKGGRGVGADLEVYDEPLDDELDFM